MPLFIIMPEDNLNLDEEGHFNSNINCIHFPNITPIEPLYNNPDESYTRNPDITGENFEQHSSIATASGALFSPGHKSDGTDF